MNKDRRKAIAGIIDQLATYEKAFEDLAGQLDVLGEDEQEYADYMPENLHGGEKHSTAEETATELSDVATELQELFETEIAPLIDRLQAAKE